VYEHTLDGKMKDITDNIDVIRELRQHGGVELGLLTIEEVVETVTIKYKKKA